MPGRPAAGSPTKATVTTEPRAGVRWSADWIRLVEPRARRTQIAHGPNRCAPEKLALGRAKRRRERRRCSSARRAARVAQATCSRAAISAPRGGTPANLATAALVSMVAVSGCATPAPRAARWATYWKRATRAGPGSPCRARARPALEARASVSARSGRRPASAALPRPAMRAETGNRMGWRVRNQRFAAITLAFHVPAREGQAWWS